MRTLVSLLVGLALACCSPPPTRGVDPANYDAFWLWAGVTPSPLLAQAKTIYLLAGEVRRDTGTFVSLRPGTPRLRVSELWLVVRVDTLDWRPGTTNRIVAELQKWRASGNRLAGLQIDFDARTRHLRGYADFLRTLRKALPRDNRLSVTGLMDWSAHGDPMALRSLGSIVDEIVIQTYQGRATIPGYDAYFAPIQHLPIPFKIGLVQGGEWREPEVLRRTNQLSRLCRLSHVPVGGAATRREVSALGGPAAPVPGRMPAR